MGVEPKIGGKPPKWMVKIMENPMNKWDDLGGFPIFLVQHPYINLNLPLESWEGGRSTQLITYQSRNELQGSGELVSGTPHQIWVNEC